MITLQLPDGRAAQMSCGRMVFDSALSSQRSAHHARLVGAFVKALQDAKFPDAEKLADLLSDVQPLDSEKLDLTLKLLCGSVAFLGEEVADSVVVKQIRGGRNHG